MGRYNFSAQKVQQHATQLLQSKRITSPPPWYNAVSAIPPSERLVRPPMQRGRKARKKASRLFQPVNLEYAEDKLRWEYFNDHPWELARPRVILENDGKDHEKWDWSLPLDYSQQRPKVGQVDKFGRSAEEWDEVQTTQTARPINGESVIKRQTYLLEHAELSEVAAYEQARKELYRQRHANEIEARVAKEEALSTGAFFHIGPLEVGMKLEDRAYENWREWAMSEVEALKQLQSSAYTSMEEESSALEITEPAQQELQEVSEAIPASKEGQKARGGAAIHP